MTLSQEEKEIVKFGAENGKTEAQVRLAIAEYRRNKGVDNSPMKSFVSDAVEDVKEGFVKVGENLYKSGEKIVDTLEDDELSFGEKARGVGAEAFRGGATMTGDIVTTAAKAVVPQSTEDAVVDFTEENVAKIFETAPVQTAIQTYNSLPDDAKREVDNALGFAQGLAEVGGLGAATKVFNRLRGAAAPVGDLAESSLSTLRKKIGEIPAGPGRQKMVQDLITDIVPTSGGIRDRLIAKSLRLAPVEDIARIEQLTGNNIGDFMGRWNLIGDTAEETMDGLTRFSRRNQDLVQNAVLLVDEPIGKINVPGLDETIEFLGKDLQGRKSPEFVNALNRLTEIQGKETLTLSDVQFVKQLFDEVESVFKRTGEVKDSVGMADKAQTAAQLRRFIEDEVKAAYPDVDIRALNNNVQTAREITNTVLKRSGKADTASLFKLGDMAILGAGNVSAPGAGFAGLFAKKILESAPVQLRLARRFNEGVEDALSNARNTLTPDDLDAIDALIRSELEKEIGITR